VVQLYEAGGCVEAGEVGEGVFDEVGGCGLGWGVRRGLNWIELD
jgi:hypothetical protein